jgi:hypothetical protein
LTLEQTALIGAAVGSLPRAAETVPAAGQSLNSDQETIPGGDAVDENYLQAEAVDAEAAAPPAVLLAAAAGMQRLMRGRRGNPFGASRRVVRRLKQIREQEQELGE